MECCICACACVLVHVCAHVCMGVHVVTITLEYLKQRQRAQRLRTVARRSKLVHQKIMPQLAAHVPSPGQVAEASNQQQGEKGRAASTRRPPRQ